jgi:3-hydroxyacyl-CoA dehydrogenase
LSVRYERRADLAVVVIDSPPVNAISSTVVSGLREAIARFEDDHDASGLIIACAGRTFVAGGDIAGFEDPTFSPAPFNDLLQCIEDLDRPVVAALHGFVFGGGLELALACHGRVAVNGTVFAMPEVKLGILPGSLGTQRLPRLVGADIALDLILTGRQIDSVRAIQCGLIDRVSGVDSIAAGVELAKELQEKSTPLRRTSRLHVDPASRSDRAFDEARRIATGKQAAYPAAVAIVDAVDAAMGSFELGAAIEASAFASLLESPESKALRHLFFAKRDAAKLPGEAGHGSQRSVKRVGIVGGGTMGRGIAINFLRAGLPVLIVETSDAACKAAASGIEAVLDGSVAKGRMSAAERAQCIERLEPTLDAADLSTCDLVIEAVFEDLSLKQNICRQLGEICKPGAIIATNTSTLDVDDLAKATGRPEYVVGMHFFSPAHVMALLEIVRGASTAPDVLNTVMHLGRKIGKVPVVSGNCWGFIGNRMLEVYLREAEFLLLEGASPQEIDRAVESLGFAMGPCRMLDMAGIDVGAKVVIERAKAGQLPADPSYRVVVRELHDAGRNGQKTGQGYYQYVDRKAVSDPDVQKLASSLALKHGVPTRGAIALEEIRERLLYPLINEGAFILLEGIAYRPSDIDVIWTSGYGFPDYLGGPMFYADSIGLTRIVERLAHYARERGNEHGYWTVSPLLADLAARGGSFKNLKDEK